MKTVIYYFTGTGNSLAAARKIAETLGDCDLVSIASLKNTTEEIVPQADRIGIACPVYDCGVPVMVAEFAEHLDLRRAGYIFGLVTMGGIGVSALHQLNGILKKRHRRGLDAAFAIKMPGNFSPLQRVQVGQKCDEVLTSADKELEEIARVIDDCIDNPPGFAPFSTMIKALTYGSFSKNVRDSGRKFSVSDACTGCGTCEQVCPAGNITLVDGKPVWDHHCELCCACLHFCPVEAIQFDIMFGTEGRGRYRHPVLEVADMQIQQGK